MVLWKRLYSERYIVCAKLEPASRKNNQTPEINVLQKFTTHTLFRIKKHETAQLKQQTSYLYFFVL